jgi:exodeoxyribonuclease-3
VSSAGDSKSPPREAPDGDDAGRTRLFTWNVNGIRAAARKGFLDWVADARPDVLCLQETRAHPEQLDDNLRAPPGYHVVWASAKKKGYSGVATWSRLAPVEQHVGLGDERFDDEGRTIITQHGDFILINGYFPNGRRDHGRVPFKLDYYRLLLDECTRWRDRGFHVVICGDWNTAHGPLDLTNDRANKNTTGFLIPEREWIDRFIEAGFVDVWRQLNPEAEVYSWWSNRFGVREKNIGWRLDYHMVDQGLVGRVHDARIHTEVWGSDHCPVELVLA